MTTTTVSPSWRERLSAIRATLAKALRQSRQPARDFVVHVLGQIRTYGDAYAGVMHALIFWGVTIQILGTAINLMQMQLFIPFVELPFPRGSAYLTYELLMDLAGVAILLGVTLAAFRRVALKPPGLETGAGDVYALVLLATLPLVGFLTEGVRLLAVAPAWAAWSPVGDAVASILSSLGMTPAGAAAAHPFFFWSHVTLGLLFVASIPFTKLRHLVLGPLNVLLRDRRKAGTLSFIKDIETTELLGVGQVDEFTPSQLLSFDGCVNCGRCERNCPAAISGMDFSPRSFIQDLRGEMRTTFLGDNGKAAGHLLDGTMMEKAAWACTTCGACLAGCPIFVNPVDEIIDLRRYQVLTTGRVPTSAGAALRNLEQQGNPWGMPADTRTEWARGLNVRELAPGDETDVLLFLGCAFAFDDRNQRVARDFVHLLQAAGVDFGILGLDEGCCGETARRLGHEYLFQVFAEQNIEVFNQVTFNRIVTQCPHCFNTLKNEYPQLGGHWQVQHYSQYLLEQWPHLASLVSANGADGDRDGGRITYHDPCYLGRYNGGYAAPRQLLDSISTTRVEMERHGQKSFCCGGGGGQMWLESDADVRINHRRLDDALAVEAETVVTACPYCMIMFDDAIRSRGVGESIQVMDIAEMMVQRLEGAPAQTAAVEE
ncbi:MAG: heterodisulfide reductase-related iron-sulfur binding cluster [Chloroflexota bacterium]|jgi:Fe-S oxidoreductase/nitrate reductase gamma subunit